MSLFSEEDLDLFSSVASFFTKAGIYDSVENQILSHLSKPEFRFNATQFATQQQRLNATQQRINATQACKSAAHNATQQQQNGTRPPNDDNDACAFAHSTPPTSKKPPDDFCFLLLDVSVDDPLQLMSHSPRLANFAFSRPRRLERLFARVIAASFGSRIASPRQFSAEEICVRFSVPYLPEMPGPRWAIAEGGRITGSKGAFEKEPQQRDIFRVSNVKEAIESDSTGLFQLRGTIVGLASPVKYVMAAKFLCEQPKCLFASAGVSVWEVLRPGDAELDPQSPFKTCFGCGKRMREDASRRCIGEKMSVTVMPFGGDAVGTWVKDDVKRRNSSFRQGIRVVVRDSFCNHNSSDFFLGKIIDVVGFAGKNVRIWRDVGLQVEAISIKTTANMKRLDDGHRGGSALDDTLQPDRSHQWQHFNGRGAALDDTLKLNRSQQFQKQRQQQQLTRSGGVPRHPHQQHHRLVPSLSSDFDFDVGESQFSLFSNCDPPSISHNNNDDDDDDYNNINNDEYASSSLPPGFDQLPDSILSLLTSSSSTPWRFTWTLAYCVASGVAPRETFHRLKLTLLLVLVMVKRDYQREKGEEEEELSSRLYLDLLVCGMETNIIDRILTYFGKLLSEKYVRHSILSTPIVRKTTTVSDGSPSTNLEAGSLHSARDGVCHLGFIPRIKKSELHLLKHSLDSRHWETSRTSSSTSSSALNERRPNCFLWGFCDPIRNRKSSSSAGIGAAFSNPGVVAPNADCLSDVFGVKVFTDSPVPGVTEAVDVKLAEFILNGSLASNSRFSSSSISSSRSSSPRFLPVISAPDLTKFLSYASSIDAELTPKAQALISRYYLASRRRRCGGGANNKEGASAITAFPATAISTLTSMAVAHAKLRVNTEATEGDALAAILLFEENVTIQSGFSLFDVLPLPHLVAPGPDDDAAFDGAALFGPNLDDGALFDDGGFDADSWLGTGNDVILAHLSEKLNSVLDDVPLIQFGDEF